MAGIAPLREQVRDAARLAKAMISSSSGRSSPSKGRSPRRHRRLSTAPRKVSPAPLVSATLAGTPGTVKVSPFQRQNAPASPSVTRTREMPPSARMRLPSSRSLEPVSRGSSSSESLMMSTRGRGRVIHSRASRLVRHRAGR